jgi:hypothetical protein
VTYTATTGTSNTSIIDDHLRQDADTDGGLAAFLKSSIAPHPHARNTSTQIEKNAAM